MPSIISECRRTSLLRDFSWQHYQPVLQLGAWGFFCGDCDKDILRHLYTNTETGIMENFRLFPYGGPNPVLKYAINERWRKEVDEEIRLITPRKKIKGFILIGHTPCLAEEFYGLSVEENLIATSYAVELMQKEHGITPHNLHAFFHVTHVDGRMRTYELDTDPSTSNQIAALADSLRFPHQGESKSEDKQI